MKRTERFVLMASIYSDVFGLVPHLSGLKASTNTVDGRIIVTPKSHNCSLTMSSSVENTQHSYYNVVIIVPLFYQKHDNSFANMEFCSQPRSLV